MKAGHSRINITPAEGQEFYLLGYKAPTRNQPALGVHDPIFMNALLLENEEGQRLFILSADILELEDEMAGEMKRMLYEHYSIPMDQIILGALHDHSSIRDFHRNWEFGKHSQAYEDFFFQSVDRAFAECLGNLQPATARIGSDHVVGYYSNRNYEGQPADNEVSVTRFYDAEDKPFAALVNWATHSTAMGASNRYLTGDLAGNTNRKLGELWGYYPVFLNGAAGDCSNRYLRKGKDFNELERESSGLADQISRIPSDKAIADGPIRTMTLSHEIAQNKQAYNDYLQKLLDGLQDGSIKPSGDLPLQHLLDKCTEQMAAEPFYLNISFEVIDFGGLRFFVFPGELGSKFGIALKSAFSCPVIVAGYSNGFHHYFLAQEDYGRSFETIGNPVPPGTTEVIVEKMIQAGRLLDQD